MGTGAFRDPIDPRDYRYEEVAAAGEPVDWEKGFDVEETLNINIPFKNQDGSGSCFPAGTKVLLEDLSYKNIEEIHVGEKVVTHNNNIKIVEEVMKRKWQGTMFTIKAYGELPVTASPEHPFLLEDGTWVEAKGLKEGQYITIPKTKNIIKNKLDYAFENDDDFLWAIGFYLAEGSLDTYAIKFSIHKNEIEYADKIKSVFEKLGANVSFREKKEGLGADVCVYGKVWAERFLEYGSKLCFNKELNKKFLTLEPKKQLHILKGWMDGDGSYQKDCFVGITTSKKLLRQMNDIAKRNEIRTAIRSRKKEEGKLQVYELQFGRIASKKLLGEDPAELQNNYSKEDADNFYVKINTIEKIDSYAGGNIYNIEVEDDHSYIVENIAVHNCVGQGWSYYGAVLNAAEVGYYNEQSAKAIYSQIQLGLPGGGAYIRDGAKLFVNWGSVEESVVPSYNNGQPPSEDYMKLKMWKTPEIDKLAQIFQAKEYRTFNAAQNMEMFAQAIRDNYGVVGGVNGTNNGTWNSFEPQPPTNKADWGHCLFFGKIGIDSKGKYIATPNSWGTRGLTNQEHADGWQKFRENWFQSRWMFNPWTLVDKSNVMQISDTANNIINNYEKKFVIEGEGPGRKGIIVNSELRLVRIDREAPASIYVQANSGYGVTVSSKVFDEIPKGANF